MEVQTVQAPVATLDPPRSAPMFTNAHQLGIHGSQFTNVLGNMNVYHTPPLPNRPPADPPRVPSPPESLYSDSECYTSQLLRRGRGFPLYVPAPPGNLPAEYRHRGVSIGDVGRVTPDGVFDFFFNIYLPADHPINDNDVPDDFQPLYLYDPKNVLPLDHSPGDHVSTRSVRKQSDLAPSERGSGNFVFDCHGPQGAALALPLGSHVEKLYNVGAILQYTRQNAESWYKYANGARGRQLSNGSLYLITGFEKTRSWGIAAFQDVDTAVPGYSAAFQLAFGTTGTSAHNYRWTASGPARTKNSGLILSDDVPLNHTVFIHGLSVSLGTSVWGRLFKNVQISQIVDSRLGTEYKDYVPYAPQSFGNTWGLPGLLGGGWSGETGGGTKYADQDVTIADLSPTKPLFHPSKVINEYIIRKCPDALVVVSHDDDWKDIVQSDSSDEDIMEVLRRACDRFNLVQEDGLATIFKGSLSPPPTSNLGSQKGKDVVRGKVHESSDDEPHPQGNALALLVADWTDEEDDEDMFETNQGIGEGREKDTQLSRSAVKKIPHPRTYASPSMPSKKEIPAFFSGQRRSPNSHLQLSDDDEDELTMEPLAPNATDQEKIDHKRRQNILAARRSRKRKLIRQRQLEEAVEGLSREKEIWKTRTLALSNLLQSHGLPCPEFQD
ncbi:hypothetical protein FB45DRAFT_851620 [Roridomyces roridus]|uniref:BZIP domain-containing protein n=1 Tax=Roridomyces roridus TaxID=1738132 RepID=A0AAD7F8A9_9AGAR|nr:hypothetical protein FB45DRAFT_851620 [Roridomyces roridus]